MSYADREIDEGEPLSGDDAERELLANNRRWHRGDAADEYSGEPDGDAETDR